MEKILVIRHKKPLVTHLEGTWRIQDTDHHFYFEDEGKSVLCDLAGDVRTYLMDSIINNPTIPGRFDATFNALIYRVDMEHHNLDIIRFKEDLVEPKIIFKK